MLDDEKVARVDNAQESAMLYHAACDDQVAYQEAVRDRHVVCMR